MLHRLVVSLLVVVSVLFGLSGVAWAPRGLARVSYGETFSAGWGIGGQEFVVEVRSGGGAWERWASGFDASDGASQSAWRLDQAAWTGFCPVRVCPGTVIVDDRLMRSPMGACGTFSVAVYDDNGCLLARAWEEVDDGSTVVSDGDPLSLVSEYCARGFAKRDGTLARWW